ncbi:putative CENPB DNA-binding domain-containing protein 1 [Palaemon carinicauda]|uniref:putative CENPB DNA-binding domain-containing protein 1 n=1 Tax=Palaemon carinicauda TaxID=392227 RepID=UPI0035B6446E
MQLVKKYKAGMPLSVIAEYYDQDPSMIGKILKQNETIKAVTPMGVTVSSSKGSYRHDEMKRLLHVWIEDKETAGDTITEAIICQKASAIFGDLISALAEACKGEGTSKQAHLEFNASQRWL